MSERIEKGDKWCHVENGVVYQILIAHALVKQPDGKWAPGVMYTGPTGDCYVRTVASFRERFVPNSEGPNAASKAVSNESDRQGQTE